MPSRSRPSSPVVREKPYDQHSSDHTSDEEDFVNAATAPPPSSGRPSSRTSHASGGSRRSKVHESSSSESVDSEEERELQEELRDAAGTETGVVRGAPVESTKERIMRSVGKGRNSTQRYASLADAEAGQAGLERSRSHRSSSSRHKKHSRSSRSGTTAAYELGNEPKSTKKTRLAAASAVPTNPPKKSNTKKILCWTFLGLLLAVLIAAIITAVVLGTRKSDSDSDETNPSNSTSLSDHSNSTDTSLNETSSHGGKSGSLSATLLPSFQPEGADSEMATASFDDGKYHPSTASPTNAAIPGESSIDQAGQWNPSATTAAGSASTGGFVVDGQQTDEAGSNDSSATTHDYNLPIATTPGQANPVVTASPTDAAMSIQTVPNPNGDGASNGGQWNALSANDPQATQSVAFGQGQGQVQGGQVEGGQVASDSAGLATPSSDPNAAPSSTLQFGVGPVDTATQPANGAQPTGAVVIGTGAVAGQDQWNAGGNQGQAQSQGSSTPSWSTGGETGSSTPQDQSVSPIDANVPGPFTSANFTQATHPETYQTYINAPATWFESSGHYGLCGVAANNTDFVVAVNNKIWLESTQGSPTAASSYCGAEVLLTSMTDGATINAWVTDRCAYCSEDAGSIDLSKAAFSALAGGSTDAGSLTLVWGFTGNYSTAVTSSSTSPSSNSTVEGDTKEVKTGDDSSSSSSSWWDFGGSSDDDDQEGDVSSISEGEVYSSVVAEMPSGSASGTIATSTSTSSSEDEGGWWKRSVVTAI